jgi:AraC-like DNA-binding protein
MSIVTRQVDCPLGRWTLVSAGEGTLADVALAAGYYDQPHMNGEFRELSGFSPREFLATVRYPESVSVAETTV